jgi:hypothetical protein
MEPEGEFPALEKCISYFSNPDIEENRYYLNFLQGLKLKKQRSTGDLDRKGVTSIRSTGSTTSWMSSESGFTTGASVMSEGSNQSFVLEVSKMTY